jgi:hypothetical protein
MTESARTHRSADQIVRDAVAAASRRRHGRETSRVLWRLAPVVAGVCAALGVIGRWMAWGLAAPLIAVGAACAVAAIYLLIEHRPRVASDKIAAAIDDDARLDGELRSAVWFASQNSRDEWAEYHLARAAARLETENWSALYPAYRAPRARLATGVLALAIGALIVTWPARVRIVAHGVSTNAPAAVVPPELPEMLTPVPEDLRKQIEDFLAAAEKRSLSEQQQLKTAAKLWNYMATFNMPEDPEALKQLAKMMDPTQKASADEAAKKMLELAEKANKAADADSLPPELRKAMQDLGTQLSEAADAEQRSSERAAQQNAANSKDATPGDSASAQSGAELDKSSIQFSKDNTAAAGASMMMISEQPGQPGGGSASGYGGAGGGKKPNNGTMPAFALEQALRRETVEASTDTAGDNVMSEKRRQTERTDATVGFTHGSAGVQGRADAAPPPSIPEDRRSVVETYFTRKQ